MPAAKRHLSRRQSMALIAAFEQLAMLADSGLSVRAALVVTEAQQQQPLIRQFLQHFIVTVDNGMPLHSATSTLARRIPPAMVGYLTLADQSGQFSRVLQHMVTDFQQRQQQRQLLLKSIRYPAAIFVVALLVTTLLLVWVLPQFTALFSASQLPAVTRLLMALSAMLQQHAGVIIGTNITLVTAFVVVRRLYPRYWQQLLLALPIVGSLMSLARTQQLFAQLALLLQSGMAATAALRLMTKSSPWRLTRADCGSIEHFISQGQSWSAAVAARGLNTPLVNAYLKTGEQTGRIDEMMSRLSCELARRLAEQCEHRMSLIQPLLMLALGGIIGTLLLAMYLPIFTMGQQF